MVSSLLCRRNPSAGCCVADPGRTTSILDNVTISQQAAPVTGDEILTSFDDDCRMLEEAAASNDRLRVKSAVVVCRRLLLEGMIHQVRRQLGVRQRLEFRIADLLGFNFADVLGLQAKPAIELSLMPDGLAPDSAPPGVKTRTLTLDEFLAHRVAVHNGTEISVADVIRFLANKDGAVHYGARLDPEDQKLRELNRSLQVMNFDALMSCVRGVSRVLLVTVLPLRIETLRRYLSQVGTRAVPHTHLEIAKYLLRALYHSRDWSSTKPLMRALLETSVRGSTPTPRFEDHMMIMYQWGNVLIDQPDGLDELLWLRAFALSVVDRLKPNVPLSDRALSVLCGPILRLAKRSVGRERIAVELDAELRCAYAKDRAWHYWATAVGDDVLSSWSSASTTDA